MLAFLKADRTRFRSCHTSSPSIMTSMGPMIVKSLSGSIISLFNCLSGTAVPRDGLSEMALEMRNLSLSSNAASSRAIELKIFVGFLCSVMLRSRNTEAPRRPPLSNAKAVELAIRVLPHPGGPTRRKIGASGSREIAQRAISFKIAFWEPGKHTLCGSQLVSCMGRLTAASEESKYRGYDHEMRSY